MTLLRMRYPDFGSIYLYSAAAAFCFFTFEREPASFSVLYFSRS